MCFYFQTFLNYNSYRKWSSCCRNKSNSVGFCKNAYASGVPPQGAGHCYLDGMFLSILTEAHFLHVNKWSFAASVHEEENIFDDHYFDLLHDTYRNISEEALVVSTSSWHTKMLPGFEFVCQWWLRACSAGWFITPVYRGAALISLCCVGHWYEVLCLWWVNPQGDDYQVT